MMKRNYKKEWEKEKETKVTRLIKIDKKVFEKFTAKLKEENSNRAKNEQITINGFVNQQILKYIEKN